MVHVKIPFVLGLLVMILSIWSGNAYFDPAKIPPIFYEWHEICADVTSVTDDQIDGMRHGIFPEDEMLKRYLLCLWRVAGAVSNQCKARKEFFKQK